MNDTPRATRLETHHVITLKGKDAVSFLQTKLTCDTRRWRIDGGGYGLATDINGKIVFDAVFALDDSGTVFAVLADETVDAAVEHIDRYVIMEDVTVGRDVETAVFLLRGADVESAVGLDPERESPGRPIALTIDSLNVSAFRGTGTTADVRDLYLLVAVDDAQPLLGALAARGIETVDRLALEREEIAAGVPRLGRDFFVGKTIPLEAGLWSGISLSKGCYLGQEVLERMYSRGSSARRLARVTWDGPEAPAGTLLTAEGDDAGEVTSSIAVDERVHALAYIKRKHFDGASQIRVGSDGPDVRFDGWVGGETPENA